MKTSLWRTIALLSFSIAGSSAWAVDCNNAQSIQTQVDIDECASQALNKADAELNQTYVDYRKRLDKTQQNQIRDVQLAWIKYRDLSCKYATSRSAGGSVHNMALQSCLTEKTLERTKELKALSACPEGDIACPH